MVWEDWRSGFADVFATRVSQEGQVLDSIGLAISVASDLQLDPAVVYNYSNFLAVWEDWRSGWPDIYGARVTPGGILRDPHGIPICAGAIARGVPDAAFGGESVCGSRF